MEYPDGFPLLPHFRFTHPAPSVCMEFWHPSWNESIRYDIKTKKSVNINICHEIWKKNIKHRKF